MGGEMFQRRRLVVLVPEGGEARVRGRADTALEPIRAAPARSKSTATLAPGQGPQDSRPPRIGPVNRFR